MNGQEIARKICEHFENCHLTSYIFPGEENLQATVGWGTAIPLSKHPMQITQEQADKLLDTGLWMRHEELKKQLGAVYYKLTPGQLGATLSFKYNCKRKKFDESTFLRLLKAGLIQEAGKQLNRWVYGSGKKLKGLIRRRKAETAIFNGASIADMIKVAWYVNQV